MAAAPAHRTETYIYGITPIPSCGAWTAARSAHGGDEIAMKYWLLGFVSGRNMYEPNAQGGMKSITDPEALEAYIDQYCQAHPLDELTQAAAGLIDELRQRERSGR